jgi:hypothetical protein
LPGPQAKKFSGFQKSLAGRSCRGVFRATFFFFGSVAAVSPESGDVAATVADAGVSDATNGGTSERTVPADFGAVAVTAIAGATRADASEPAPSVDCGAAAVTVMGGGTRGGGSERTVSVGFGPAAVTVMGGAIRGGSERAVSAALGAAAVIVAAVGSFDVTRDGWSGRAGVTNDAPEDCTIVPSEGS